MRGFEVLSSESRDGERLWRVRVDPDCAFFEGHFDGRPILPAVAELALVEELLSREDRAHASISEIANLRFRAPLPPGETFDVRLGETTANGSRSLEIRSGERRLAFGTLTIRVASADA